MSRDLIDSNIPRLDIEGPLQFVPERGAIAVDLADSGLVEIAPAFGEMVDGQLLRRCSVDVVRQRRKFTRRRCRFLGGGGCCGGEQAVGGAGEM